jgi:hypothetical protein
VELLDPLRQREIHRGRRLVELGPCPSNAGPRPCCAGWRKKT